MRMGDLRLGESKIDGERPLRCQMLLPGNRPDAVESASGVGAGKRVRGRRMRLAVRDQRQAR